MKDKVVLNFLTSDKITGDSSVHVMDNLETSKNNKRRESVAPKIVVCPPIEDMAEEIHVPRGERLLKALGSRLSRKRYYSDSDGSSSSSDIGENSRGDDRSSCSISESDSDGSERQSRHRSTISLRRLFQSLNLTSRSQSCSPTERRQPKKQAQPKRILRSPVTYTYVRGLSGLPQRVPRQAVCYASSGLNP